MKSPIRKNQANLQQVVNKLDQLITDFNYQDHPIKQICTILQRWEPCVDDDSLTGRPLKQYMYSLDPNSELKYGRTKVYECQNYVILMMHWPPGTYSLLHDHGKSSCWVKLLEGRPTQIVYELPDQRTILSKTQDGHVIKLSQTPKITRKNILNENKTISYINNAKGMHVVGNLDDQKSAHTIHFYSPGLTLHNMKVFQIVQDKI